MSSHQACRPSRKSRSAANSHKGRPISDQPSRTLHAYQLSVGGPALWLESSNRVPSSESASPPHGRRLGCRFACHRRTREPLRRAAAFLLPSVQHRFLLNPIRGRRAAAFLLAATQVGGVKRGRPIDLWLPSRLVEAEPSSSGCAPEETLDEMPPSRHSILTIVWQLHDFSEANQDQERLCHPVGLGTCRSSRLLCAISGWRACEYQDG
ncbi:hypothetical protein PVAP13_5KG090000 [Panicum virgatum]|uniref:Uncharacterized protein n=1 Tax=Panicum virgatum TaxID=38727 RepID=A0A8T0SE07_PANVG|nr:hypothetical protein PVAP13_5KG090000 [Panicum virgatum]